MKVSDPLTDHLPQLDQMLQRLESGQYDELYELFGQLDQTFGTLYGTYVDELHYLAAEEPQNEVAEKIGAQFVEIRPLISALRDDLSLQDYPAALETLRDLKEETITLYSLFGEYRQVADSQPKLSQVPYTHELVRVTRHYLEGALSVEAVHGRFEVFCQYHELLETQLSTMVPSPPEREAFEESREDLEEALAVQLHGIEDLDLALERNDREGMEEALELLLEASEVLVEIYQRLQRADLEPRTISCIKCGADNSLDSKICGECAAVLPQSAAAGGPTSTIAVDEAGLSVTPQEPEEVARLRKAVQDALHGGDPDTLARALESYSKKIQRSRRQFESLEEPPKDIPAEHRALLLEARAIFAEALETLEAGFQKLSMGSESLDHLELEAGLELMQAGSQQFLDFQRAFQEAQQVSNG